MQFEIPKEGAQRERNARLFDHAKNSCPLILFKELERELPSTILITITREMKI
jgi:hypothetical protein